MTKQEATAAAIERIKGQDIEPGRIVASNLDPRTWELVRYEGENAICRIHEEEATFPRSEIFDMNKLINVANHLLNVGFWEEGMESMIINIP